MTVPVDARLRGGRAAASLLHLRFEVVPQRDRVIVLRVMRAVDQCYITLTRRFAQWLERGGIGVELGKIQAAKLLPLLRRSGEHTSELQSRLHLVCRPLLEKKKKANRLPQHLVRQHC